MTNKQIYIGLGLIAVAIVGVIIYNKSKKEEEKSNIINCGPGQINCTRNGVPGCCTAPRPSTK